MKILNLYAGIGGNRKYWGNNHDVVAVEIKKDVAGVYKKFFPNDKIIIADAHKYLEKNYKDFDFIWSSPPCPTHSRLRNFFGIKGGQSEPIFPNMKLYEEIIFMQHMVKLGFFKGKYCIENVISYYKPLIAPQEIENHYFWTNFYIPPLFNRKKARNHRATKEGLQETRKVDLTNYEIKDKRLLLRNCLDPDLGKYIFDCALGENRQKTLL